MYADEATQDYYTKQFHIISNRNRIDKKKYCIETLQFSLALKTYHIVFFEGITHT